MPYSKSHGYAFIAVPKTGSTSVVTALRRMHVKQGGSLEYDKGPLRRRDHRRLGLDQLPLRPATWVKHLSILELRHLVGGELDGAFKFAFVRNPWARCVSRYLYSRKEVKPSLLQRMKRRPQRRFHDLPFDQWVARLSRKTKTSGPQGMGPQGMVNKLRDAEGNLAVDFIGRLETIDEDYAAVCRRIGLEPAPLRHRNRSENRKRPYQEYYTPELLEMVAEMYRADIDTLGYQFEGHDPRPVSGVFALPG